MRLQPLTEPPVVSPAARRPRGTPRRAPLALAILVTLLPLVAPAHHAGAAHAAAAPSRGARPAATATASRALPDSVLVRLDGREDVTRRRFERAVMLLGGRPDSLTPGDRDRFLDLVIEQRVLAARALREPRAWEHRDSAQFAAERDNIYLRAALSDRFTEVENRRRALGQPDLDERAMGMAARESLMAELQPQWDGELVKSIGSYFAELPMPNASMGAREQMALAARAPQIPAAETTKVLVRTTLGTFTVAEMLADWRRLSSLYKPRVRDGEAVKELIQNSLFERVIRKRSEDPELRARPIVAAVVADRVEFHSVNSFLQTEVLATIPRDSLTLLQHYRAHMADFDRPASASLVILTLETEHAADSVARRFTVPGEAESLAFRAQRTGVRYTLMVTENGDSALFRRAKTAGTGGVGGPEKVEGGWRVFKVLSIEARHAQPFEEVRRAVETSWNEVESERRIRRLLDALKRETKIERNERALQSLVAARAVSPARRSR